MFSILCCTQESPLPLFLFHSPHSLWSVSILPFSTKLLNRNKIISIRLFPLGLRCTKSVLVIHLFFSRWTNLHPRKIRMEKEKQIDKEEIRIRQWGMQNQSNTGIFTLFFSFLTTYLLPSQTNLSFLSHTFLSPLSSLLSVTITLLVWISISKT